jgi:hypothetical protein
MRCARLCCPLKIGRALRLGGAWGLPFDETGSIVNTPEFGKDLSKNRKRLSLKAKTPYTVGKPNPLPRTKGRPEAWAKADPTRLSGQAEPTTTVQGHVEDLGRKLKFFEHP